MINHNCRQLRLCWRLLGSEGVWFTQVQRNHAKAIVTTERGRRKLNGRNIYIMPCQDTMTVGASILNNISLKVTNCNGMTLVPLL